jgi:hypothetical protein
MDVEKFVRHMCRLVLRHQMPVWNYFVNSFYSVFFIFIFRITSSVAPQGPKSCAAISLF